MDQQKTFNPSFDLAIFSALNMKRCIGTFRCADKTNLYFTTALAEEVGEICGVVKKLDRGFNEREEKKTRDRLLKLVAKCDTEEDKQQMYQELEGLNVIAIRDIWERNKLEDLSDEIADVFIHLDLLCTKNGINLWEAVERKFNRVSDEMKCPEIKINSL